MQQPYQQSTHRADGTQPHLVPEERRCDSEDNDGLAVPGSASLHCDVYSSDWGEGTPVYDAWAIEDDKTSADPTAHYEYAGSGEAAAAAGRGFRTPAGRPSSNELWRFRLRGCQDCWAALFFFALLSLTLLWGVSELYYFELSPENVADLEANTGIVVMRSHAVKHGGAAKAEATGPQAAAAATTDAQLQQPQDGKTARSKGDAADREKGATQDSRSRGSNNRTPNGKQQGDEESITTRTILRSEWSLRFTVCMLVLSAFAVGGACVGLLILGAIPRTLIMMECWVEFGVFAALGLLSSLSGNLFAGILFAVFACIPLVWLYLVMERIPFAAALLTISVTITRKHKGLVVVAVGSACVLVVYGLLAYAMLMPAALRAGAGIRSREDVLYATLVVFTALWVQQVLLNIVHVTVAGVVATWYFVGGRNMPANPIRASLHRATSASLGSICLGSLFVAIIRFLRFLADAVQNSQAAEDDVCCSLLACVCNVLLSILDSLLQYFNSYAFVHVAIYGCSYFDAAKRTWALTQQCFFAAVFNDCLAYQGTNILNLLVAVCMATITGIVSWSGALAGWMFLLSIFVNSVVFEVIQSTVTTIFVCFAEVPEGMEVSFPELYEHLMALDALMPGAGVHQRNEGYGTV